MMGFQETPARLFYDFCLDEHVPADHLLRGIDRHLDLTDLRQSLKPFYSPIGRPSVDPELMIRMLIVGYGAPIDIRTILAMSSRSRSISLARCRLALSLALGSAPSDLLARAATSDGDTSSARQTRPTSIRATSDEVASRGLEGRRPTTFSRRGFDSLPLRQPFEVSHAPDRQRRED